jgi:glycosyltransferase involved in cell wall biosynthesis
MTPRIAVVSHDISGNALGRALVLAELLDAAGPTRIVGFGSDVWAPARGSRDISALTPPRTTLGIASAIRALRRNVADDTLIVACKTRVLSYGVAAMVRDERPLILDIDDLEHAFVRRRLGWLRQLVEPDREPVTRLLERVRRPVGAVTVASRALQRRFGGTWLPHVRDRASFAARATAEGTALRHRLRLEGRFVIGFVGTPRPHKGLGAAARAVASLGNNATLLLAGTPASGSAVRDIDGLSRGRLVTLGAVAMSELPAVLGACDVVVVPQELTVESAFQSPAKLFDAMAAGCAIVATDVGDARRILGHSGLIVAPGDHAALGTALAHLTVRTVRERLQRAAVVRYRSAFALPAWQDVMRRVVIEASTGSVAS